MKKYLTIIALLCLTSACESQDILSYTGYSRAGIGYEISIEVPLKDETHGITVDRNIVYVCSHTGLIILDAGNTKEVSEIAHYGDQNMREIEIRDDDGGEATGVWGNGKLLFVEDNSHLEILDISDPADPMEIAENKRGGGHSLCIKGNYVYIASYRKGLIVFQFSEDE